MCGYLKCIVNVNPTNIFGYNNLAERQIYVGEIVLKFLKKVKTVINNFENALQDK